MRRSKIVFWSLLIIIIALTIVLILLSARAEAATNISNVSPEYFAWNEITNWWNLFVTNSITVSLDKITGYASSSIGYIYFDSGSCPGSPNPCLAFPFQISNETTGVGTSNPPFEGCSGITTTGQLSGYAWNDTIGWISFSCTNENPSCTPSDSNYYRVSFDKSTGDFSGWAWNDVAGWISFNSLNHGGPITYKVRTTWAPTTPAVGCIISPTITTQGTSTLNSIIWQGTSPSNTCVDFQIATSSNPGGPWNFSGWDGTNITFYGAACDSITGFQGGGGCSSPNTPICVNPSGTKNTPYLRYKVRLSSDPTQTISPQVNDVILNWSR